MKKVISFIIITMMLVSSTFAYASNGNVELKNNNIIANIQNQIKDSRKCSKIIMEKKMREISSCHN